LVHPLATLTGFLVLSLYVGVNGLRAATQEDGRPLRNWFLPSAAAFVPATPLLLYLALRFTQDPFLRLWNQQNQILSPPLLVFGLSYLLILVPAVYGAIGFSRERDQAALLPVSWVLIAPLLAYAPHNLQRRLPEGVFVAWLVLAAFGFSRIERDRPRLVRRVSTLLLILALAGPTLLWVGAFRTALRPAEPAFRHTQEVEAFRWLGENAEEGDVVTSSYATGNAMPAWAPVKVVVGHGPESVDLERLQRAVEELYHGTLTSEERGSLLSDQQVEYVFYGPAERALGAWPVKGNHALELRYQMGSYRIFKVLAEELGDPDCSHHLVLARPSQWTVLAGRVGASGAPFELSKGPR
jgi:hypothetical protein